MKEIEGKRNSKFGRNFVSLLEEFEIEFWTKMLVISIERIPSVEGGPSCGLIELLVDVSVIRADGGVEDSVREVESVDESDAIWSDAMQKLAGSFLDQLALMVGNETVPRLIDHLRDSKERTEIVESFAEVFVFDRLDSFGELFDHHEETVSPNCVDQLERTFVPSLHERCSSHCQSGETSSNSVDEVESTETIPGQKIVVVFDELGRIRRVFWT